MTAARPRPSAPAHVCAVPGCGQALAPATASGVCRAHVHCAGYCRCAPCRAKRGEAIAQPGRALCAVPGCGCVLSGQGRSVYCKKHWRWGKAGAVPSGAVAVAAAPALPPIAPVLDHWHHARACRMLWQHVIHQAFVDATDGLPAGRPNREARAWLTRGGRSFQEACQGAGYDAEFIRDRWRRVAAGGEAAIDAFGARLRAASPTTRAAHPDFYGKDAA